MTAACGVDDRYYGRRYDPEAYLSMPYPIDWAAAADSASFVLVDQFLDKRKGTFCYTEGDRLQNSFNCYWQNAHAMDVVVDAYLRRKSDPVLKAEYEGCFRRWRAANGNNYDGDKGTTGFKNGFTDDMSWIVLTLLRMYEATGEADYFAAARDTYDLYIITRWTDVDGGGLPWKLPDQPDKNECTNAPACLIACRLYDLTQQQCYLRDAVRIYNWMAAVLFNAETGALGQIPLSYTQGTFLEAARQLYHLTGDGRYLRDAVQAARYNITAPGMLYDGLLRNEGDDANNTIFRGIFMRYAVRLANDRAVDAAFRRRLGDFIRHNAIACWTRGVDKADYPRMFFGAYWGTTRAEYGGDLGCNVSAATLLEAMTVLK